MNSKRLLLAGAAISSLIFYTGCSSSKPMTAAPAPVAIATSAPAVAQTPATAPVAITFPIRIKAGLDTPLTNSDGTIWLADQGFTEGDTVARPDLEIANTTEPEIYRSERYSMTSFNWPLPNGKYIVKLHFCETYEGITGPGMRVFSFNVEGHEFKDLDLYVKAGPLRAYIETVPVEITDGKLNITFTPNVENPQINGIEIFPSP
jgi:hypothetical protein